jgi:NADH-quinone oxidoreductase subunit L
MPITYATVLIGAIANAGLPPFSGFFSKESIIEALHVSQTPGAGFAYLLALGGVFAGAFYTFRLVFFAFHGKERFRDAHGHAHTADEEPGHEEFHGTPHESPWVVTLPLVLLAIPSVAIGWLAIEPMLYGGWFGSSISATATMAGMAQLFHGAGAMVVHAFGTVPFWLDIAGVSLAAWLYLVRPDLPAVIKAKSGVLATILERKYGFDDFNDWFFAGGARALGGGLAKWGDRTIIDGIMVNGTARLVGWFAGIARRVQTGYVYHYAFTMIIGVFALLTLWLYHARI